MTRRIALTLAALFVVAVAAAPSVLAHPGHEHKMMGTVTMVGADHVMLKDKDGGDATVYLSKDTKIIQNKKAMKVADIKVGMRVVITATTEKDQVVARTIELGAAPAAQ